MRTATPTPRSVAALALALASVCVYLGSSEAFGGFSSATVRNTGDTVGAGALSITHTYASTSCSATPTSPTTTTACTSALLGSPVPSSGTSARTDAIANNGTFAAAAVSARYRVAGCGPVQLANAVAGNSSGAMLPRTGTTFSPATGPMATSGSITLNGTSGFASGVAATSEPTGPALAIIATYNYGLGVWFKSTSATVGPLFGFGSNPLDVAGSNDRILYLDASGKIAFVATTSGVSTTPATASGVTKYNDGAWHFAYVSLSVTRALVVGLSYSATIYVDGLTVTSATSGLLGALTSYSGYWHLGWSPVAGTARYFSGSLSGFTVDDSGSAPTTIASNPTSYTSFDATRTEQWRMDDSGGVFDGTTVTGTLPSATSLPSGAADPCTYADVTWALTSPAATVLNRQSLRTAVTASWQSVSACPGPGATQTSTVTVQRDATFNSYAVGLILYVPMQAEYSVGTTAWTDSFSWGAPAAGTSAGSVTVVG